MVSADLASNDAVVGSLISDAIDRIGSYPPELQVGSWITQAVGRRVAAVWGKADLKLQHETIRSSLPAFDSAGRWVPRQPPLREFASEEAGEAWAAIVRLPPIYRMAFVLRDVHGVPDRELTQVLGPCDIAVREIVHRARCAVAESLLVWSVHKARAALPRPATPPGFLHSDGPGGT
ncbi:MAG: hypothetical protein SFZ23_10390 [Planctomycetota bacterium]|nr:hypothetical protein [Planctomycetota bacterium]